MKNILITGAAGFLGSHIAMYHLRRGDKVFGVDNFCTSLGPESPHVLELTKHPNFFFEEADICSMRTTHFEYLLNKAHTHSYHAIYNAACPASPPRYQALSIETLMTCTVGVKNVLEVARLFNAKIMQFSTSEVYGDPEISPQPETYWGRVNSFGVRSCYDEGKRFSEALCYDYLHKKGVDVRLARIFNTFGTNMDPQDGRVVTNFVKQALKNEDITIYGSGLQTRSFCYVDDLVAGITGLMDLDTNPMFPVNVGNPTEFTMLELANLILKLIPTSTSKIVYEQLPGDDPTQRRPDITRIQKLLPWWCPQISLEEGLERMIPYIKSLI